MKNLMKEAHEMTRKIVEKYGDVDYKTQLGLCLSFLASEEGEKDMINYETLEYTFVFEKASKNIEVTLKDNGEYKDLTISKFLVEGKEFKVSKELTKTIKNNKYLYLVKMNKEMKKEFKATVDYMSLSDEIQEFLRSYIANRDNFLEIRDEKRFDENKKIKATVISRNGRSLSIDYKNAYAEKLVQNINSVINTMLKHLDTFKTSENTDAHHSSKSYELTGKDLIALSEKATEIVEKIEKEKSEELAVLKEKARLEGKQLMEQWTENKRCEVIICKKYMMPNGEVKVERERTY